MAFAQGSRSSLSYATQSDFVTPATSGFVNLPFSTQSLNMTKDAVVGNDIQADRMPRVQRHGNKSIAGDIVVDLRDEEYDDWLESAMLSTWSTNDLTIGTTPKYFTVQDYAEDIDQARFFRGCAVNSLGVSIAPNQMVTTTFGVVGRDMEVTATQIAATDSDSTTTPFDSYSGSVSIGNADGTPATAAIVTSFDFTLTNGFAPTYVVGDNLAPSLEVGRAELEGTMSVYFEDDAIINRFVNETESELTVSVGDGTKDMTFFFPRVKINSADVGVDGPTSRIISCSFTALYNTTDTTSFKITRAA